MKSVFPLIIAACAALAQVSCETIPIQPIPPGGGGGGRPGGGGGHHDDRRDDRAEPLPRIEWELHSRGRGYELDIFANGRATHIADGGEYIRGRRVSRSSRDVPAGTVSAFEVLLPDGEVDLYWIEEGRPGTLLVYTKFYDAYDRRWSSERRLRSIRY